jgi:hypothetical protein
MHFGLGMWIRNEMGLHDPASALFQSCGAPDADSASGVILNVLWNHLVQTATPDELAESRQVRAAYDAECQRKKQEQMEIAAAKDAAITDRRCASCGKPCPSYRTTCKYCGAAVAASR